MIIDRKTFFDHVRARPFGGALTQGQVDGMETLLDEWERLGLSEDPRHLAYILAGVYHETGGRMVPVREGFAKTDQGARDAVAQLYRDGKIRTNYALPVNGVSYYGRGRIQVTWHENYEKLEKRFGLPFVSNPDLLLDSVIDAGVVIIGHFEGLWTGLKVTEYFTATREDPVHARRVVNGLDKADLIAGYYTQFLAAVRAAASVLPPEPGKPPAEPVEPIPVPPDPLPLPERKGPLWVAYMALAEHFGDPAPIEATVPPMRMAAPPMQVDAPSTQVAAPPKESPMLPAAILAPILTQLVTAGVQEALRRMAVNPNQPVQPYEVPAIASEVSRTVNAEIVSSPQLRQVEQRLTNATNQEPWYQSRVLIGTITGIIGTAGAIAGFTLAPEDVDVIAGAVSGLIAIGGNLYAWYGRRKGAQLKPLGS